jgi:hypothetical protein
MASGAGVLLRASWCSSCSASCQAASSRLGQRCGLTLRSSADPQRLAALRSLGYCSLRAASLRGPLSSNVRQHTETAKVLATAAEAAVAAKDQMHLQSAPSPLAPEGCGLAQAPRLMRLRTNAVSGRFAATSLWLSKRCFQSVRGAAATREPLPAFTAGSGGGMVTVGSGSSR